MTKAAENLRQYLEQMAGFVRKQAGQEGFEAVVLERGRAYEPAGYDAERYGTAYCVPKECTRNAAQLATDNENLTYCEGYAATEILPLWHAWCVDENGRVVDPTWAGADTSDAVAYYGVEVPTDKLWEIFFCKREGGRPTYGVADWDGWYNGDADDLRAPSNENLRVGARLERLNLEAAA